MAETLTETQAHERAAWSGTRLRIVGHGPEYREGTGYGFVSEQFPHFGLRTHVVVEDGVAGRTWSVTHLPTGMMIGGVFARRDVAERYLAQIAPLTDWSAADMASYQTRTHEDVLLGRFCRALHEELCEEDGDFPWEMECDEPATTPDARAGRPGGEAGT